MEMIMQAGHSTKALTFVVILLLLHAISPLQAQLHSIDSDRDALWIFLQNALPQHAFSAFNRSQSPCQWPGIACFNNRIQVVDLEGMNLSSSIPQGSIGKLDELVTLNLFNNSISGTLPNDLWDLPLLQSLNISKNLLGGSISIALRQPNSSFLLFMDLSQNQLAGQIPAAIGSLKNLLWLNLSRNLLQDAIPDGLFACTLLQQLDLSYNSLSGSIPAGFAHLPQLEILALNNNKLQEMVPSEIGRLHYLSFLDLSHNKFTGPFPRLDGLRKLEFLNISGNFFSGRIPVGALRIPGLKVFSARNNRLLGNLPAPSAKQSNLTFIDLGMNSLSGNVSASIWIMNSLETLRLDGNKLSGALPLQVGGSLRELDLSRNEFSGEVSENMAAFQGLVFVDFASNRLTGFLPEALVGFPTLVHLGLGNNPFLESRFPNIDQGLAAIEYLNFSAIQLVGHIPDDIGKLQRLKQLDLSHNELNGTFPSSLGDLASLTSLDLSYNHLNGSIPESLANLKQLQEFNASYNDLSGSVPDMPSIGPQGVLGNRNLCGRPISVRCPISPSSNGGRDERRRSHRRHFRVAVLVGIITGSVVAALCLAVGIFCCGKFYPLCKKKQEAPKEERYISMSGPFSTEMDPSVWASGVREPQTIPVVMFEKPLLNLTFSDVVQATSNFSKEAQLPDSGSGPLFQGVLPGGIHVTVKILGEGIPSDDSTSQLAAIWRLKHPNVVPLLGYCMVGVERLLIYEQVQEMGDVYSRLHELPEGVHNTEDWSTDTWEHGQESAATSWSGMTWAVRHKVALGTARALAFLHHGCSPPVVHGDVKASNVLLDAELEPRLAGTGLTQLVEIGCPEPGYVPPESSAGTSTASAAARELASPKGDVFAFGVLLLELVTGKRPVGDEYVGGNHHGGGNVVQWTRSLIKEKRGFKALDVKVMRSEEDMSEMLEALRVAYLCTADSPNKRPTMQQVVGLLKDLRPASSKSGDLWSSF